MPAPNFVREPEPPIVPLSVATVAESGLMFAAALRVKERGDVSVAVVSNVPLEMTTEFVKEPRLTSLEMLIVPELIVVLAVYVLVPLNVKTPVPLMVSPPARSGV